MTPVIVIIAVLAALAVFINARPSEFTVSRSITVDAPPSAVFPHVNDLRKWEAWSPWAKLDPDAKTTFEGPAAGTGAVMAWDGNKNIGAGRMTITASRADEAVRLQLDFVRPFKGTSTSSFDFKAEGGKTLVVWGMQGKNNFMGKVMGLFMNCEKMVGEQYEKGLNQIKAVAEGKA